MAIGTVKWFNVTKGYGYIRSADGTKDVFFDAAAVQATGLVTLANGTKVSFETKVDRGTTVAANLKAS